MARTTAVIADQQAIAIKEQLARVTSLVEGYISGLPSDGSERTSPAESAAHNGRTQELVKETYTLLNSIKGPFSSVFNFAEQVMHIGAVRALFGLGAFHALPKDGSAMSAGELAGKLHSDKELLVRLMRLCTIWGPFKEVDTETYSHTPFSLAYIDPNVTNQFLGYVDEFLPACLQLHAFLDSNGGNPPEEATNCPYTLAHNTGGKDMWDHISQFPERSKVFNSAMYDISTVHPWPVALYPFRSTLAQLSTTNPDTPLVVDVGGGQGQALCVIRRLCGDIQGRFILQDRADVLDAIPHNLPGIEKIPCDLFKPQPVKGATIYFLRHVLHDWAEGACVRILENIATAITDKKTQRVIISDMVLPQKGVNVESATQDLVALNTTGAERSKKQWQRLLTAAGFRLGNIYSIDGSYEAAIECFLV